MRVRTKTLPPPRTQAEARWNGVTLGAVQAQVVGLPFVFVMYWLMGWEWWGLLWFGAWVFFMTLWWKVFDLAVWITYAMPEEER